MTTSIHSLWLAEQCRQQLESGEARLTEFLMETLAGPNRFFVEFGANGHGPTYPLRARQDWQGLLMDASPSTPDVLQARINVDNINAIFSQYDVPHDFDLLAIDIDSNDYWVWQALDNTRYAPRVVAIEYNCFFPPDCAVSVTYDPNRTYQRNRIYGASAAAFVHLARAKHYSLICVVGFMNLVFVRNDLITKDPPPPSLPELFKHPIDIPAFAREQNFNWLPTWINAPDPDINDGNWCRISQ